VRAFRASDEDVVQEAAELGEHVGLRRAHGSILPAAALGHLDAVDRWNREWPLGAKKVVVVEGGQ
jgi:hypothetical protein